MHSLMTKRCIVEVLVRRFDQWNLLTSGMGQSSHNTTDKVPQYFDLTDLGIVD